MDKSYYKIFFEVQKEHWWFVSKKKIVLDFIKQRMPHNLKNKILDVGCGSGLMLSALERLGETSGLDASDEAIAFSQEIFSGFVKKGELPNNVPYKDNYFNLITALDVIEHIENDVASLLTLHSKLVAGGLLVVTVPAFMFLWSEHDELNQHKRRYTRNELKEKLILAGFEVEKISYFNFFLFPLIAVIRLINRALKHKSEGSDVKLPNLIVNWIFLRVFSSEVGFLRLMNLPFGVSIIAIAHKKEIR